MQRVSSFLPSWDARRRSNASTTSNGRASIATANGIRSPLEKVFRWSNKPTAPLTTAALASAASRVGREAFWPATLDAECDRSARILKSFCSDGFLAPLDSLLNTDADANAEPKTPARVFKKIPPRIIQDAAGIAIFTCMRSGLWMTGSGGSGILIARKADGTWSPPSGILLHTPSLSFIMGVDIYDCVLVINNIAALESLITKPTVTLGEDISLTTGPLVALESTEVDSRWKDLDNTVLTYMKARGQTQNVNLNGCILTERANENERFYGTSLSAMDIAAGNVSRHVEETRPLFEVIKEAEGRVDADQAVLKKLSALPAPGDAVIETPKTSPASPKTPFGIPLADDPDPFGVLALEMAGLEIREAGTRLRPTSSQFEFHPAPSSPAFSRFRQSSETFTTKSNRGSLMSTKTSRTKMSEAWTQTNTTDTPATSPSQSQNQSEDGASVSSLPVLKEPEEVDYTKIDFTPLRQISGRNSIEGTVMAGRDDHLRADVSTIDDATTKASSVYTKDDASVITTDDDIYMESRNEQQDGDADDEDDDEVDEDDEEEEPVIFEIAAAQPAARTAVMAAPIHAKGALVTIPKRIPPPLPPKSPMRSSRASKSDIGDVSHLQSPLQSSFTPSPRQSIDSSSIRSGSDRIPSITETVPDLSDDEELEKANFTLGEKTQQADAPVSKTATAHKSEQATPFAPGAFPDDGYFLTPLGSPLKEVSSVESRQHTAPKAADVA
ncbi:LAS seventeen-binding protein [Colletotrichum graminicola]|uniref:LAS seventeen-binding protein n=1 Tax=Colletotrichum graminicola (strain M1.001 / M2 / FGSC 10212) TaxID=645133 RepID=E3Q9T2_COLGM|nr:LAS seventeen-binding protein [Colletotrichum graminicola M1.001]EFQ27620.1 LAS seventeen-binding protein [Colletotrichum graminicola M1.001]WDK11736.1 LAS seventeen-binding protein [Colletotrichum graminicola]